MFDNDKQRIFLFIVIHRFLLLNHNENDEMPSWNWECSNRGRQTILNSKNRIIKCWLCSTSYNNQYRELSTQTQLILSAEDLSSFMWNWHRWPDWLRPTRLLESLWQGSTRASLVGDEILWHQRQDHEIDWGISHQQNPASCIWEWRLLQRFSYPRAPPALW